MKTLFLCNLIPTKTGAFERLLIDLSKEFHAHGDTFVIVFAGEPVPAVAQELGAAGARWRVLPGWTGPDGREHRWRFCAPALRMLAEERPEVAVLNFGNELPALLVSLFTRRRTRWVWQQHQQMSDPTRLTRAVSRIRLLRATFDRFVTQYDGGKRSLALRGIPERVITVIYNGIPDCRRRQPAGWLRRELGVPEGAVLAVSVGSLIARKRISFQIRALAGLPARAPVLHLALVGDGPEREGLEALAGQLGVARRVHFLGLRNDVSDALLDADLLIHTSLAETCTYAITESMAAGIPAVVTEAGAAREQIEDGASGYVLTRADLDGFSRRLAELAGNSELRRSMGEVARRRWQARYRLDESVRRYHELYRGLAPARP